jgi:predicted metal-binding protein
MSKHTIFVCKSCAFSLARRDYLGQRGGKHLCDRVQNLAQNWHLKDDFVIQEVECLSACNRPCVVAFAAPKKTTLMFGDLLPFNSASAVLQFAEQYFESSDGLIQRQDRPEVLQKGILARIPPLPSLSIENGS